MARSLRARAIPSISGDPAQEQSLRGTGHEVLPGEPRGRLHQDEGLARLVAHLSPDAATDAKDPPLTPPPTLPRPRGGEPGPPWKTMSPAPMGPPAAAASAPQESR